DYFFFSSRRRHTRSTRDWSSDVCSSDLHDDGWLPDCCLTDRMRPLLHTIAYGIRGLLEGGRVLEDARLVAHAALAAERIAAAVGPDGRLPGRFAAGWSPAAPWSCLTGEAQLAKIWRRLFEIRGD